MKGQSETNDNVTDQVTGRLTFLSRLSHYYALSLKFKFEGNPHESVYSRFASIYQNYCNHISWG